MTTTSENAYLVGNFAPVRDELTVTDLPVQGRIPPELSGRLFRNGPNPIAPDPASYHWFTGDGMLHAIELRDGKAVSYRNRWVRTDGVCAALGEEPPAGQPDDVFIGGSSVANTHVMAHAGQVMALVEVCLPTAVGPDLSTLGRRDYGGALWSAMTAHPKLDPVSGELHFFGYDIMGPPWLRYHVADATGRLVSSEDIAVGGPVMIHDFAITEHNVVFFDLPVVFNFDLVGKRSFPFEWKPDYGARVGVMPRGGTNDDVRWSDVELCYVYHPLNAYDDGDRVVVDLVRHPSTFATDEHGPGDATPRFDRWTIDAAAGKVVEETLDDRGQEFPRCDPRLMGRPHRYGYAATFDVADDSRLQFGGLLKQDVHDGVTQRRTLGAGQSAGEPVFVPAHASAGEDEGWVLSVVYDADRDGSDLVILDATDFTGPEVARITLPQRVPYGFHGSWVADDELTAG
jgi:carotenoid cleavage dioxygenase